MRRERLLFSLAFVLPLALPVPAQQKPGTVAGVSYVRPKAGMRQQFEQADKLHMQWHRQQKDTWTIFVWEVIAGDHVGQYGYASVGHHWKDLDDRAKLEQADEADYHANVSQYADEVGSSYWIYQPEISRPMTGDAPLLEYVKYHLNMGGESDFAMVVRKVHEAMQKSDYPAHWDVYRLFSGGEHPTYGFVFPHKNWADFEPPEQTIRAVLEKAYGRAEADSLLMSFSKAVHCVQSEIWAARPDLSYLPEAK